MSNEPTNLRVLSPSRKKPLAGDIFAMQLLDGDYLFGRVVGADLQQYNRAPMPGAYLIYVYNVRSPGKQCDLSILSPDRLLLPPVFVNRMPWTKGFFDKVGHEELSPRVLLKQHCFWDAARARYVDEQLNPLPRKVEPCGDWGLSSYRWLDDQISDALGIPRVPEGD